MKFILKASKLETQESWFFKFNFKFREKTNNTPAHIVGQEESPLTQPLCSIDVFIHDSRPTHIREGNLFLLGPLIQLLTSSRNTLKDTIRITWPNIQAPVKLTHEIGHHSKGCCCCCCMVHTPENHSYNINWVNNDEARAGTHSTKVYWVEVNSKYWVCNRRKEERMEGGSKDLSVWKTQLDIKWSGLLSD